MTIERRKTEHLNLAAENLGVDRQGNHFDAIHLVHRALPELDHATVNTETEFLAKRLSFPLLISAMTGGDSPEIIAINQNLAQAAETMQVAMSVGSQRILLENEAARPSFELRQFAPTTLLFANLGAVQLNYGVGVKQCRYLVELLGADALVFHLNPLQEVLQAEGNGNFSRLIEKIAKIRDQLPVPVILKEVGCGFSAADAILASRYGFDLIDVAGRGGTSWSLIEHQRGQQSLHPDLGLVFQDWGVPTPDALRILHRYNSDFQLIASGGLRNGLDMVKSMVLGASLCGMALPFLKPAMQSSAAVVQQLQRLQIEFKTAQFLLGVQNTTNLQGNASLLLEQQLKDLSS